MKRMTHTIIAIEVKSNTENTINLQRVINKFNRNIY